MTGTHSVQRFLFRLMARNEAAEHFGHGTNKVWKCGRVTTVEHKIFNPEVMGSNPAGGEALSVLTLMQLYGE